MHRQSDMFEKLRVLFERLVAELPSDTARLNIYRVPKGDGTVIELLPTNRDSASYGVHVDDDGIDYLDFSVGRIGTWELPQEGRNRKASAEQLLLEIEQMSRAIIAGKCEETRGPFWLTSKIYADGYTYKMVDMPMLPILPFRTRRYAPYVSDPR
jgi:hypothetical protein